MRIDLVKERLLNFQAARDRTVQFDRTTNTILGPNRSQKTTLFDAFVWSLFGKNSAGKANFDLRTVDPNTEQVILHLSHEVELDFIVDGEPVNIRKQLIERWEKIRGDTTETYKGNKHAYYFNNVIQDTATQFSARLAELFDEQTFRLVTDPTFFNNDEFFPWKKRRDLLFKMAGGFTDEILASGNEKFLKLLEIYRKKGTDGEDQYKKEVANNILTLKKKLAEIDTRIDENKRSRPEPLDWNALEIQITDARDKMDRIESLLSSRVLALKEKSKNVTDLQQQKFDLEISIKGIESAILSKIQTEKLTAGHDLRIAEQTLKSFEDNLTALQEKIEQSEAKIKNLKSEKEQLTQKWHDEKQKQIVYDEDMFSCVTCKRPLEAQGLYEVKELQTKNFNEAKVKQLAKISAEGKDTAAQISTSENILSEQQASALNLKSEISKWQKEVSLQKEKVVPETDENKRYEELIKSNESYSEKTSKLSELKEALSKVNEESEDDEKTGLELQKKELSLSLDELKAKYAKKEDLENRDKRDKELEKEHSDTAQRIAEYQHVEDVMMELTRHKVSLVDEKINSLFKVVKFKMFNLLNNGGTEETCICMVDGVPYPSVNTGHQILAGIDIINVLCKHYDLYAPIWIDNAESITEPIECISQVIKLHAFKTPDGQLMLNDKPI